VVASHDCATLCATRCRSLTWPVDIGGVRLGAWPARAIGFVTGASAGYALSAPGAPPPVRGFSYGRNPDADRECYRRAGEETTDSSSEGGTPSVLST